MEIVLSTYAHVSSQANALAPNWGQHIFQSANEIANTQIAKARMAVLQGKVEDEREWWDLRKKGIQEGFMKELDEDDSAKISEKKTSVSSQGGLKGISEEDAVLVEAGGPTGSQGQSGTPGKKKNKK